MYSPLEEKSTLVTMLKWSLRICISFPLGKLHTRIVLSLDADAKYSPFGEDARLRHN